MFKQPNSSDMTGARITIGAADATKDKKKVKSEDKTDELPEIIKELKSSMDESENRIQKEKSLSGNITITSSATFAPFIHAYIKEHGPTEHHLNSFNQLKSLYLRSINSLHCKKYFNEPNTSIIQNL